MLTFFKANVSSSIASFVDYFITIFLVSMFRMDAIKASVCGTVTGGVVNFFVGRNWVFDSKNKRVHQQASRYAIVWVGNLFLNTGGMYIVNKILGVHYVLAKLFVSLTVGFCYNYTLQKRYVFKNN